MLGKYVVGITVTKVLGLGSVFFMIEMDSGIDRSISIVSDVTNYIVYIRFVRCL